MLTWLSQHIITIVIIAVLALIFGLMLRSLIRDKKAGKSSCGGGCAGCANAYYCHPQSQKPAEPTKEDPRPHAEAAKGGD